MASVLASSPIPHFTSGCFGKAAYATATKAFLTIKRLGRKGRLKKKAAAAAQNRRLTAYRCCFCHQWHIGSEPK